MVIDLGVQVFRDDAVADAHLQVRADRAARQDGCVFRLDRPDLELGVLRLEHLADAADRATRAEARAETVDRAADLFEDLGGGVVAVHSGVCRVVELAGNEDSRVVFSHFVRNSLAFRDAVADIARIVYQNDFRAVVLHQLAALLGNRVRHDDLDRVALDRAAQRKADALVAAGRLDDDRVRMEQAAALGVLEHVERGARLDRAADIQTFKFDKHIGRARRDHAVQTHHRRMADRFQNVAVYH